MLCWCSFFSGIYFIFRQCSNSFSFSSLSIFHPFFPSHSSSSVSFFTCLFPLIYLFFHYLISFYSLIYLFSLSYTSFFLHILFITYFNKTNILLSSALVNPISITIIYFLYYASFTKDL